MEKPIEYHYLEVNDKKGKIILCAPKDLDLTEYDSVKKFFRVWCKFYERKLNPNSQGKNL